MEKFNPSFEVKTIQTKEGKKENEEVVSFEQQKSIDELFKISPELNSAVIEAYEKLKHKNESIYQFFIKYVESIFPESQLKNIVWHGSKDNKTEKGFKLNKEENTHSFMSGDFYGFYFGDYYSHYGWGEGEMTHHPVVLNIKKPKILIPNYNGPSLGSIDMTKNIKEQCGITDEDGIIEPGPWHANEHVSKEEFINYEKQLENKAENYFKNKNIDLENVNPLEWIKYLNEEGLDSIGIQEIVVFESEKIHILGSKSDIENFKTWTTTLENSSH